MFKTGEENVMLKTILGVMLLMAGMQAQAAIRGDVVNYKAGDTSLIGYLAYDDAIKGKRPGVIVVPDWWGHGEFVRDRARALARLGYTAMVMDIYGGGTYVEPPEQASTLMNQLTADPKNMKARFLATKNTLRKHKTVNGQIGAVGYSLGGLIVIEMARQGVDLDAVASVWGVISKPGNPAEKGTVRAKLLIQQPAEDGWAPIEEVNRLKKEMSTAGADIQVIVYPDTVHAFSRPDADQRAAKYNLGIRYDAAADKQSWADLDQFLKIAFKNYN
jgi:dienelactone hydrolase